MNNENFKISVFVPFSLLLAEIGFHGCEIKTNGIFRFYHSEFIFKLQSNSKGLQISITKCFNEKFEKVKCEPSIPGIYDVNLKEFYCMYSF